VLSAAMMCFQVQAQTKSDTAPAAAPVVPGQPAATGGGETTMKIEDAADTKNKVKGDLDKEITDARIRAESGSKSKLSMSTGVNYRGGSIERPFGTERPDLSGGLPDTQRDTSLSALIRMRYRTTKNESYTFGAEVGMKTPFAGDINADENQLNIGDPALGYNKTWAAMGLQNSWNIGIGAGMTDESKNIDLIGNVFTDYTLVHKFQNKITLGTQFVAAYNFYDTEPGENPKWATSKVPNKNDKRGLWTFNVNPSIEYSLTDKLNLRALFSYFRWRHLYGDDMNWRMLRSQEYNSLGLGIAARRDIYLYPNVQFLPRDIRSDYTNFAMSATMNF
jgi:hypothetical protein